MSQVRALPGSPVLPARHRIWNGRHFRGTCSKSCVAADRAPRAPPRRSGLCSRMPLHGIHSGRRRLAQARKPSGRMARRLRVFQQNRPGTGMLKGARARGMRPCRGLVVQTCDETRSHNTTGERDCGGGAPCSQTRPRSTPARAEAGVGTSLPRPSQDPACASRQIRCGNCAATFDGPTIGIGGPSAGTRPPAAARVPEGRARTALWRAR